MKRDYLKKKKESFAAYLPEAWIKVLFCTLFAGGGIIYAAWTGRIGLWWIMCPVSAFWGFHMWHGKEEKRQIKFYRELEVFVENLNMFYGYYNDVDEAVYDSMLNTGKLGYRFGRKMEACLKNLLSDREWEESDNFEIQLMKIGRCAKKADANPIFIQESLRRLKEELREDIYYLEEMRIRFQGLISVCFLPIMTIPFLENWVLANLEELDGYYYGVKGFLSAFFVFLLTMAIGWLLYGIRFGEISFFKRQGECPKEILWFHNWILLEREQKESNVERILEGFLGLSGELGEKVSRLHYDYMDEGSQAIAKAREEELCMPYVRILEGLLLCDKISVKQAFANTVMERNYELEKRKNHNKRNIRENAALGRVIAFLPLYGVSIFFLIVPFIMEGLGQLKEYSDSFGNLL